MKRHYEDWTIEVTEFDHWAFGRGFHSTAYISKMDGTKSDIREFYRYDGVKTHKAMLEYTQKLLSL